MHFYNFHIKDYRAKTAHLTPLEHYIYRTLIDWYYLNEKPFESVEQIARYLLLPLTDENHTAINAVLDEFFNYHKGKYHHSRINEEVKDYRHKNGNDKVTSGNATDNATVTDGNAKSNAKNNKKPLSSKERQDRCKKRKRMLNALLDKGITLDKNASFDDVCNAYNANFGNESNETGNASDNESNETNNGKNGARTINHKPITNNQEPKESSNAPTHPTANPATPSKHHQTGAMANPVLDTHPSATKKSKSSKPPKFDAKSYPIGDSVDFELWCDFVDMRNAIKKPLTENACKQFAKDFENWANEGLSPNLAIAESIKNSWQGVFRERAIVKIDRPQQPNQPQRWGGANDPLAVNKKFENYDLEAEAKRMGITFVDQFQTNAGVQLW